MIFHYHNTPIHYTKQGKGSAIVFLHGFLENSNIWDEIAPFFYKTHTVITIDLPGFGKSECVAAIHTMELMATITSEILAAENIEQGTFIGHSMGGYVILALAELFPNRIKKLILLNSTAAADTLERKQNRTRALAIIDKNKDAFVKMAIANLFTETERTNHLPSINKLKKEAQQLSSQGIKAAILGMRDRKNRMAILKNLKGKSIIISGKKDLVLAHEELMLVSKSSETTLFSLESGHMSWLTNAAEIVKIVHFNE